MSLGTILKFEKLKKGDVIKIRRAEKKRQRIFFKQFTSKSTWHDCSDGFICDADILEEHYRFASRAVKKCGVYMIGHRAFVPYDGIWPNGNAAEKIASFKDCVVYRFYNTRLRQDVAFRLPADRIPELNKMTEDYCLELRGKNDKPASYSR